MWMICRSELSWLEKQLWISVIAPWWLLAADDTQHCRCTPTAKSVLCRPSIFPWRPFLDAYREHSSSAGALRSAM